MKLLPYLFLLGFIYLTAPGAVAKEYEEIAGQLIKPSEDSGFKTIMKHQYLFENVPLYQKGFNHGRRYYKDYNPFAGSFFSSLIFPPAGLVTATTISAFPPKVKNLMVPDTTLLSQPMYYNGYYSASKRRKLERTWTGFVTGTLFFFVGINMFYPLAPFLD